MDNGIEFSSYLAQIEAAIDRFLPPEGTPPTRLHAAMRYTMQGGGKRLRPVLVLAAADLFRQPASSDALAAAVAVECVHTYSLIHDDLPCMDNDDLRRGRPTAHKAFDEATALLAGDALLTHAFSLLAVHYSEEPSLAGKLVRELADAAGSRRLIGGQMADLLAEKNTHSTDEELEFIHLNKTAAMIEASLVIGGLCGRAPEPAITLLYQAGRDLGLAFQIIDDILDATADNATLGKTAGKDAKAGKTTFVKHHGIDGSRRIVQERTDRAVAAFQQLPGNSAFLVALARDMAHRPK